MIGEAKSQQEEALLELKESLQKYTAPKETDYLKNTTGSPLNLDNYVFAAHYLFTRFPKENNPKILDVGCFAGLFLDFIKKEGYSKVIGIEESPFFAEAARKIGVDALCLDARSMAQHLEKESFDIIFCIQVIHNDYGRPIEEVNAFAEKVSQQASVLLKSGGIFFCSAYIPLPLERMASQGFRLLHPSFSSRSKNYIFEKKG